MAAMAAGIARDRAQALRARVVAHVVYERPCAIQRRRAQIVAAPLHDVARRIAHTAADALDASLQCLRLLAGRLYCSKIIAPRARAFILPFGARPLVEELAHVGGEVAHDG